MPRAGLSPLQMLSTPAVFEAQARSECEPPAPGGDTLGIVIPVIYRGSFFLIVAALCGHACSGGYGPQPFGPAGSNGNTAGSAGAGGSGGTPAGAAGTSGAAGTGGGGAAGSAATGRGGTGGAAG